MPVKRKPPRLTAHGQRKPRRARDLTEGTRKMDALLRDHWALNENTYATIGARAWNALDAIANGSAAAAHFNVVVDCLNLMVGLTDTGTLKDTEPITRPAEALLLAMRTRAQRTGRYATGALSEIDALRRLLDAHDAALKEITEGEFRAAAAIIFERVGQTAHALNMSREAFIAAQEHHTLQSLTPAQRHAEAEDILRNAA